MAVTGYGRAEKEQVQRMVQVVLGLAELPRPDDAADALAVAVCLAHALSARGLRAAPGDRVARGGRRRRSAPIRWCSRSGGVGYRVFCGPGTLAGPDVGQADAQAAHPPPRARGRPGAVRLPHDRGAGLLRAAHHGHRRRAQGRAWPSSRRARGRPAAGHPAGRRGGPDGGQRRRQAAGGADRAGARARRSPRPARRLASPERAARPVGSGRSRSSPRSRRSATRRGGARGGRGAALAWRAGRLAGGSRQGGAASRCAATEVAGSRVEHLFTLTHEPARLDTDG